MLITYGIVKRYKIEIIRIQVPKSYRFDMGKVQRLHSCGIESLTNSMIC